LPGKGLIGVATSKQIGAKPQRNRAKRRLRECVRIHRNLIDNQLDYVFIVNLKAATATFPQLLCEAAELIDKSNGRWASESECFSSDATK
jgi:ribonuclease P protein component